MQSDADRFGVRFSFSYDCQTCLCVEFPFLGLGSAAQARLVIYLKLLSLYTNGTITIHGFRSGTAILLSLLGASKDEIAQHIGWSSTRMVDHYTQVDNVLAAAATSQRLNDCVFPVAGRTLAEDLGIQFQNYDNLISFQPFFAT
jgi:predicted esterase